MKSDRIHSAGTIPTALGDAMRPARSIPFIGRVDVPAGCPLDDADIVGTLNDALAAHAASLERFTNIGPLSIHRINAILLDDELRAAVNRYRIETKGGAMGAHSTADAYRLADVFLSLGIV
jgi:hypothetical protein